MREDAIQRGEKIGNAGPLYAPRRRACGDEPVSVRARSRSCQVGFDQLSLM